MALQGWYNGAMIGKIIQQLLDEGFFVTYSFALASIDALHSFTIKKRYRGEDFMAFWEVGDWALKHSEIPEVMLLDYVERNKQYINALIAQSVNSVIPELAPEAKQQ